MSNSPQNESIIKNQQKKSQDPWDEIGFHRPLGGYMYNYVLGFVGLIFGVLVAGLLISLLYPYPESKGYRDLAGQIFIWAIPIIDFGISYGIERFIAEWKVKDQERMLEYIRFFVWYQMFASLMKTTIFSIWSFTIIPQGTLAYLNWNILFVVIRMYPGIFHFPRNIMVGLQQYHKASLLNLFGSEILDKFLLLAMIGMWRNLGNANPSLGELMTMSFGCTITYYIKDMIMFIIQMIVLKPMFAKMNLNLVEIFRPSFSRETIVTTLKSGLSVSVIGILATINSYFIVMLFAGNIMNYTTFSVLLSTALSFINFIDYFGKIDLTAPFSEAYQNGKRELSKFYIAQNWKYWGYVNGSMMCTFLAFLPVLAKTVLAIPGLGNYGMIGLFLLPSWIQKFFLPIAEQGDTIIVCAKKLKQYQFIRFFEEAIKVIWIVLIFFVFQWQNTSPALIGFIMVFATILPQWIKSVISWIYIKKQIINYSIPIWQGLIAPFLSAAVVYGIVTLILQTIFPILSEKFGPLIGGVIIIISTLFIFPPIVFPFCYGLFGGWDDFGIKIYEKSVKLAGPSKPFYRISARLTRWAAKISPLTNKFAIPHELAEQEIQVLMSIKQK